MKQFKTKFNKFIVIFAFSTLAPLVSFAAGPAPVNTGTASSFAILTKSGVTDVPASIITGNVGSSPISGTATLLTCPEVTGTVYSDDTSGPLPCRINDATLLTTAVSDMQTAYADAAGRSTPTSTDLGAGNIGGLTITPGLYKWNTDVTIPADVTLLGSSTDVWIFQISGNLSIANGKTVQLSGGAVASNVFWQVGGGTGATIGTTATFNGTILSATQIILQTGSTLNGRALSQTQVTLDHATVNNAAFTPSVSAVLHVIKSVINTGGGLATSSDFMLSVKKNGSNVGGSPLAGAASPGNPYTLSMGTYVVSEIASSSYTENFSGDCDSSGNVTLAGVDKICTITNTYIVPITPTSTPTSTPTPTPVVSGGGGSSSSGGSSTHYGCKDPNATNYEYFSSSNPALCIYSTTLSSTAPVAVTSSVTPSIVSSVTSVPRLPNTGFAPRNESLFCEILSVIGLCY